MMRVMMRSALVTLAFSTAGVAYAQQPSFRHWYSG